MASPESSLAAPRHALYSPLAWLCFLLTAFVGLALDLATKSLAFNRLAGTSIEHSATYQFIPGWVHFHVTANHGAVFGLGQGQRTLFLIVSLAAIGFIVTLFASSDRRHFYQFLLGLLLAGVLGNLYDRLVFGYVRDMIYALPGKSWPGTWTISFLHYPGQGRDIFPWIFNVADSFLCCGVALMILYSFLHPVKTTPAHEHAADPERA
jgi:signal peptidase II